MDGSWLSYAPRSKSRSPANIESVGFDPAPPQDTIRFGKPRRRYDLYTAGRQGRIRLTAGNEPPRVEGSRARLQRRTVTAMMAIFAAPGRARSKNKSGIKK